MWAAAKKDQKDVWKNKILNAANKYAVHNPEDA